MIQELRLSIDGYATDLDTERLGRLARTFPECRTALLAETYLTKIDAEQLGNRWSDVGAMLELHDEDRLIAKLRPWANDPSSPAHTAALDLLTRLGDSRSGAAIVDAWPDVNDPDELLLARCADSPEVRRLLERQVRAIDDPTADSDAFTALAAAHGLPEATCRVWQREFGEIPDEVLAERWPAWRQQMLDGDALDVLVEFVDAIPPHRASFWNLGLVDDDRIRTALRRIRNTPGADVQWAIGELALAGDEDARRDLARVRELRLYGWMDDASANARTLGPQLALIPYWIGEVETVCCRRNGAGVAIEELTDFDVHQMSESGLVTQRDHVATWWRRVDDRLEWSRITDRFEIAPR